MEPIIQILNPFRFSRPLKLALLISILLSFSSYYKYLLVYILQLLDFYLNKNYVFLLSNGIIVFIFKSSGLIGKSSLKETALRVPAPLMKTNHNEQNQPEFAELKSEKKTPIVETSEEAKEMEKGSFTPEGEEKVISIVGDEDEELWFVKEYGEDDEEGELGSMSTEELNEKCEDFIRRMKATINSESNLMQREIMIGF
ncbi:hypothetical protein SLEP1_g28707 [Rubroshorea leprosula]|uniref:Uncharacterized protein n=1 Tax=Rubroshorea leprosula TaxID=152421 RepID=A0AAV5K077_9ROSI|nr:hypothetical protein SLEP1_g28707 [Rubroshorea leprosula]